MEAEQLFDYEVGGYKYEAIDLEDYTFTGHESEEELVELLRDPLVRICNIYKIVDKQANLVPFRPNWAQRVVLHAIYIGGYRRIAVPKARQIGFSTLFEIICLDTSYFTRNAQSSIVDQTQSDASEKLDKCHIAWEHIPARLRLTNRLPTDSKKEMEFPSGGSINAGKNARGGTNQALHISEWGPIAWEDPRRSTEIMTGAIPSVPVDGYIFAESTFKGGKGGDWYYTLVDNLAIPPHLKTAQDFLVLFFPWWIMAEYQTYGNIERVSEETMDYLTALEKRIGVQLTEGQKIWYQIEKERLKDYMLQEYPSTMEEMWTVREPGLIYAKALDIQRSNGLVSEHVKAYGHAPVYTAWDIGAPANTKVVVYQVVGDRILFLRGITGGPELATPSQWVKLLKELPYNYGGHFLPHDGELLWQRLLMDAGLKHVVCVPRCANIWDPIKDALEAFPRCEFNSEGCGGREGLIASLDYYHSKEEADGMTVKDVPVHDWSSHFSSAFATSHGAIRHGLLIDRSAIPDKPNQSSVVTVTGGPRKR